MREAEARVDDEDALGRRCRVVWVAARVGAVGYQGRRCAGERRRGETGQSEEGDKNESEEGQDQRTRTPQVARKVVVLENHLVIVFLHIGQVEDGLGHEQVRLLRRELHAGESQGGQRERPQR